MRNAKDILQHLASGPSIMDSITDFIIRPPRDEYDLEDLGPDVFRIGDDRRETYTRVDFELENMRGQQLQCSWFKPLPARCLPCIVYCHANCGSRYHALEILPLLQHGFSIFALDFSGSGQSDGEFISLGFYERQDLAVVMDFLLLKKNEVNGVALWGRSMGAVTAIMYASKDPFVRCIICDSPFSSLRDVIADLVEAHGGRAAQYTPQIVLHAIVEKIKKRIMKRAAFDMDDLDTCKYAAQCRVPAIILHGEKDDFVRPARGRAVAGSFAGPCIFEELPDSGHNDDREDVMENVLIIDFLKLYLIEKPKAAALLHEQQEQQEQQEKEEEEEQEEQEEYYNYNSEEKSESEEASPPVMEESH